MYYLQIVKPPPVKIYLPPSHREIIDRILQQFGIAVEPTHHKTENHDGFTDGHSHLECEINYRLQLANIFVNKYGKDLEWQLRTRVRELCRRKIESISFYLDMTDPGIIPATRLMEKANCYFAGVFSAATRPYLVLQYLNNVFIDYDQVETDHSLATELVDYIKGCDPNQD